MKINPPEIKEFKIRTRWRIIWYIQLVGLGILFALLILSMFDSALSTLAFLLPAAGLVGFYFYWMAEEITGKLSIEQDQVVYKSLFRYKALPFDIIKGYRNYHQKSWSKGDVIVISTADDQAKSITISKYSENQPILLAWLGVNFPNTDTIDLATQTKELLEDTELGSTPKEVEVYLGTAKKAATVFNTIGVVLGIGLIFWYRPPAVISIGALLFVLSTFVVVRYFKGMIYFNNKTNSPHPYVLIGLMIGVIGIVARGIMDYELVSYGGILWVYVSILALLLCGLMLVVTPEFVHRTAMDIANVMAFLFIFFIFSFGAIVITNCTLDPNAPKKLITTIADKHIANGKNSTNYYIKLNPVGEFTDEKFQVKEDYFEKVQVNDSIALNVRSGLWGLKWVRIGE